MSIIDELIVKLTAQTDQFKAGMAEASAQVTTSTDSMRASLASATAQFSAFDAIQKGSIKTSEDLAAAQKTLSEVQASGAYTSEELAAKQAIVDAAMAKVGKETEAASGALNMFTRNSRTMYSTSALITDAMTGQFSRMRREVAALGNETGLMASAMRAAMGPVGALAAVVGSIAFAAIKANDAFAEFEQVVNESGGIIGLSAGQLQQLAVDIGQVTGKTFDASDAVKQLGASGRFTGDELRLASTAAVEFASITGEKMSDVANKIIALDKDPKRAIVDLNDQFHFLTQAEADQVVQLLAVGDKAGATKVALEALANASADRTAKMASQANVVARAWDHVKNAAEQAFEVMGQRINVKLGGGDIAQQLAVAKQDMLELSAEVKAGFTGETGDLQQATAKVRALTAELNAQTDAQKRVSDAQRQTAETLDVSLGKGKRGSGESGQIADDNQMDRQNAAFGATVQYRINAWKQIAAASEDGSKEQINALEHINTLQKQIAEDAKRAATESSQQQKKLDDERVQSMQDLQQEIKQDADQQMELARQAAQQKEKLALDDAASSKARYQLEFAQGKITAQQLVTLELQAIQQKLDAETAYYTALEKLDAGNVLKVQADQFAIVDAVKKSQQEITDIKKQALSEQDKVQKRYQQVMEGAMTSQVNAMIFQHQTLRNAVANIAESMAETWIANEIKTVIFHDGVEASKTAATLAGNAARTAADEAGQAQSLLVQGEAAVKWIMTEAAKAAAGAFNAMVSIPYIGPFVAVGASIAAFATVAKLVSSVASAEGGWERVPADGMQTILHKDEMVLPKSVADPVRNMARGGGNGGGMNVHIHAMDAGSFKTFLKKNPAAMSAALAHAGRNGW